MENKKKSLLSQMAPYLKGYKAYLDLLSFLLSFQVRLLLLDLTG